MLTSTCHLSFIFSPPSALAMMENFVDLKPGNVVVQNGANSAVGRLVIQESVIKCDYV